MASSGSMRGNGVGNDWHFLSNWQLAQQDVANNRSLINWQSYAHFNNGDSQLDNGYTNSSIGMLWQNTGRVKNYDGNITTKDILLGSGSFWISHNADGTCSLLLSGAITFYGTGRSENYGTTWTLTPIPRHAVLNSAPNFYDTENPVINYSNPALTTTYLILELPNNGGTSLASRTLGSGAGGNYTLTLTDAERAILLGACPNSNTMTVRFVIYDYLGGVQGNSWLDRTMVVANGNPVFTTATYKDANSATATVTGNDQYIVQGYSTLEVDIASANKAIAQKSATMTKYNLAISSINTDVTYTTSAIAQNLGTLGINADATLNVKAIDSRTNYTTVPLTIHVLPYVVPQITATVARVNNFETSTNFHIEGVISRLTISGTDKNTVNTTSGVRYRYKKTTVGTWGSWVNVASTTSSGNVSTTDFNVATALDRNFAWDIQVEITDKLNTSTQSLVLPVGIPIFRIGLDGHVYNNEQPLMTSHVGQIIQSTALTTASAVQAIYGGTWVLWGVGRTIVGVDTSQTEFDTVEKTGGHKLLQGHTHIQRVGSGAGGATYLMTPQTYYGNVNTYNTSGTTESTGGGNAQNLQPYITAYQWKRTA